MEVLGAAGEQAERGLVSQRAGPRPQESLPAGGERDGKADSRVCRPGLASRAKTLAPLSLSFSSRFSRGIVPKLWGWRGALQAPRIGNCSFHLAGHPA